MFIFNDELLSTRLGFYDYCYWRKNLVTKDTTLTKVDFNSFFTRLQEQNETVASWSDTTIIKCKQVLKKILVENGYLDNVRSQILNPILIDFDVKEVIENINHKDALIAFCCL